ncbi:MAG TPA: PfkB family carbohydrate kinase [Solirubrobacteraceae bacterium]|nr:PfkB family carbohydrate kinase [Solirubrobacteraceae bacterium]
MSRYDYVAVGHVTCDVLVAADGTETRRPGGTAFYSALQAARLGLSAAIVTQGVPSQIEELLGPYRHDLDLRVIPAPETTTLATRSAPGRHGTSTARSQRVLAWAGAIVEPLVVKASILHLAPVARETPARVQGDADFVGITPQGLVRDWPDGDIRCVELDSALLPKHFDAAVISEHELMSCDPLFAAAQARGACVAVTAGSRPATVHVPDGSGAHVVHSASPPTVAVRDDLGAGDVFAAAFFVALAEGQDPVAAASFANAGAAVRIAGSGPGAIGTRVQIEALLA